MNSLLDRSKTFLNRNAAAILTCVGGVGVVATSVMAVKATPKALTLLKDAEEKKGEKLTKTEIVKVAGPIYIPSVVVGVSTIACIFGANALNKRKQAALMSAYALLDSSYKDYKNKVEELYGEEADAKAREEIAKDKYDESDIDPVKKGKELFYDYFSNRYFKSTIEDVQRAEYYLNRALVMRDGVSLNEFYDLLKIPHIESGDEYGWTMGACLDMYCQSWIDFSHETITMEDRLECHIITMQTEPILQYYDYA